MSLKEDIQSFLKGDIKSLNAVALKNGITRQRVGRMVERLFESGEFIAFTEKQDQDFTDTYYDAPLYHRKVEDCLRGQRLKAMKNTEIMAEIQTAKHTEAARRNACTVINNAQILLINKFLRIDEALRM